ncbi:MAG TPA: alpha/beta hydrolase [Patescibacteria group bacterium]|nr:alpha/beta hydrolase [Patescibacteria group bacterium]
MSTLSALFLAPFAGQSLAAQPEPPHRAMRILQNVPYYTGPSPEPARQDADLYLPEGKKNFPMLFFIPGGGWKFGSKVYPGIRQIADICYDMGIGVMSINYRLYKTGDGPTFYQTQERDIATAFAWLHKNGPRYGADPHTIFVMGGSAGAHLAALLGADPRYLKEVGLSPKNIKGVILASGLYDMSAVWTLGHASGFIRNQTPGEKNSALGTPAVNIREIFGNDPKQLAEAGAAAYIGHEPDTPPYLISFCDNDIFSLAQQAIDFYDLFVKYHLPAELNEQPGRTHPTKTSGIGEKLNGADDVLGPAMERFMRSVMNGTFAAPGEAVYPPPGASEPTLRTVKNLRYYDGPGSSAELNSLDLYLPEGKAKTPLVMFVHGFGWRAGGKGHPIKLINIFSRMGIGLASVNYRLAPDAKWPAPIEDLAHALAWLHENAAQYNIDPSRMILVGEGQAGGQMVSLLALDKKYLSNAGVPSDAIKGVIAVSSVYDLTSMPQPVVFPSEIQQEFGTDPAALKEASPSTYVSASAPPFLITFAEMDRFMVRWNTLEMYDLMLHQHAPVQLVMVPTRTHEDALPEMGETGGRVDFTDDVLGPAIARFVADQFHVSPSQVSTAAAR